jgi:hypothetical protein
MVFQGDDGSQDGPSAKRSKLSKKLGKLAKHKENLRN